MSCLVADGRILAQRQRSWGPAKTETRHSEGLGSELWHLQDNLSLSLCRLRRNPSRFWPNQTRSEAAETNAPAGEGRTSARQFASRSKPSSLIQTACDEARSRASQ